MPRDGSGIFTKPFPDVVAGTTVESAVHNGIIADFTTDANAARPIVAGGTGANNALQARTNLQTEVAMQAVTNYDSHTWQVGSFSSATGATGSPDGLGAAVYNYFGIAMANADRSGIVLEARNLSTGVLYVRKKVSGVWGAWTAESGADLWVDRTGDTMSGDLTIQKVSPTLNLDGADALPPRLQGRKGTNLRWIVNLGDATVETTDTIGSNFSIVRTNNAGTPLSTPFTIIRETGLITIANNLQIQHTAPLLDIRKTASGQTANLLGTLNGNGRWGLQLGNASPESGSDTGSDFDIIRYNDAGTINSALAIRRSDGQVGISGTLVAGDTVINNSLQMLSNASATSDARIYWKDTAGTLRGLTALDGSNQLTTYSYSALVGTTLKTNGVFQAALGIETRAGTVGTYNANVFNLDWTGTAQLWINDTNMGTITGPCDYRIKKDVADLASTWDAVKAMRPIRYTQNGYTPPVQAARKRDPDAPRGPDGEVVEAPAPAASSPAPLFYADDIERWGFLAHELQETLLPTAATGVKDDPSAVQSLNYAPLVAALTRALQEAMDRIEALEAAGAARER